MNRIKQAMSAAQKEKDAADDLHRREQLQRFAALVSRLDTLSDDDLPYLAHAAEEAGLSENDMNDAVAAIKAYRDWHFDVKLKAPEAQKKLEDARERLEEAEKEVKRLTEEKSQLYHRWSQFSFAERQMIDRCRKVDFLFTIDDQRQVVSEILTDDQLKPIG